jgi:hypothetical protein
MTKQEFYILKNKLKRKFHLYHFDDSSSMFVFCENEVLEFIKKEIEKVEKKYDTYITYINE